MNDIDIQRLRLEPGDVLVVTMKTQPSESARAELAAQLQRALDRVGCPHVPALFLTSTELSIIAKSEADVICDLLEKARER